MTLHAAKYLLPCLEDSDGFFVEEGCWSLFRSFPPRPTLLDRPGDNEGPTSLLLSSSTNNVGHTGRSLSLRIYYPKTKIKISTIEYNEIDKADFLK